MTTDIGDPVSGWMWDTGMSYDNRDRRSRERLDVGSVGHGEVI